MTGLLHDNQQGTRTEVGIYLPYPVFCHGQLYVAFSRARAMAAVKVKVLETNQACIIAIRIVTL